MPNNAKWFLMKSESYDTFKLECGGHRFLQALELDTPDPARVSTRYMFVDSTDKVWGPRLLLYRDSLINATTHAFTVCNISGKTDTWPSEFKHYTCPDDMPVVARGPELLNSLSVFSSGIMVCHLCCSDVL